MADREEKGMKVWKRILIKTLLFAVVAAMIFATGAMSVALVKRKKHI